MVGDEKLTQDRQALELTRRLPGAAQRREQDADEDRDDANDHEQLDQRESGGKRCPHFFFLHYSSNPDPTADSSPIRPLRRWRLFRWLDLLTAGHFVQFRQFPDLDRVIAASRDE